MKVAQITGTCRCVKQGFEDYALPDHTVGAVAEDGAPLWSVDCFTCGAPGHVRAAELIGPEPVGPLADHELIELSWEREELRRQISLEERVGPAPWPPSMARYDALECVAELAQLEEMLVWGERQGHAAWPAQVRRRQRLRTMVRDLLATPAF